MDYKDLFLVCSDLHFDSKTPANRKEKDWIKVGLDKFKQVLEEAAKRDLRVIVAGDFFEKSAHNPELVNKLMLLIANFEDVYVIIIPGNHDIKNHNISLIEKSSIWTLNYLDNVMIVVGVESIKIKGIKIDLFAFGEEFKHYGGQVAVIHEFVWQKEPWPGAPKSGNFKKISKKLKKYDLVIAGDNHVPFIEQTKHNSILNCGSMLRKNIDQVDHKPCYYVIFSDLKIMTIPFKINDDVFDFTSRDLIQKKNAAIEEVAEQMTKNITFSLDFRKNMKKYCAKNKISKKIITIIEGAME